MKVINKWDNETLYLFEYEGKRTNVTIARIRDRKGTLLRVQTSITNDFETYDMTEVKSKLMAASKEIYVGKSVTYTDNEGKTEHGSITSWNDKFIFVRFGNSPNGVACKWESID